MVPGVAFSEVMIILLIILLLFGSKEIPQAARRIGKIINELRKTMDQIRRDINNTMR